MLNYDALASEILEGQRPRPNWVKAEIRRTDVWVALLEELNIAEADKALPERYKPPAELRREVQELARLVCPPKPYNYQHDRRPSVELLNLVFEIQPAGRAAA